MADEPFVTMYHEGIDAYHDFPPDGVPAMLNVGWVKQDRPPEAEPETTLTDAKSSEPDGSDIEEH